MLIDNRSIDNLGRICVPKEMRKELKLDVNVPIEITCDGQEIKIKKKEISCVICNSKDNLEKLGGKYICEKCIDLLRARESPKIRIDDSCSFKRHGA